ncbi:MAG TPA: hypothetical protein VF516_37005 [Kofleriaceae bacterium]
MRPTNRSRPLRPNAQWPPIVRDILEGDPSARTKARTILWQEVQCFVERVVRLPIGPLNEDEEARRDIAVRVLVKLEKQSNAHLAAWYARQLRQRDHSSFWTWIKTISWSCAIDHARTSRLNIAPRSEKRFDWIRIDCVDPQLLCEALGNPRSFLDCGADQDVESVLADLQAALRDDLAAAELVAYEDLSAIAGESSRSP